MSIKLFTDSSADISVKMAEDMGISVIPLYISFDGERYYKEHIDMSSEEFYDMLSKPNAMPKTSCPPIADFISAFEKELKKGNDIVCVCISSKLSSSYQIAVNAGEILSDSYDNKVLVIDSMGATGSQALLLLEIAKMTEDGLSLEDIEKKANELKRTSGVYFTLDDLGFLQRGGRIGKASALLGTILNIKPILKVEDGEVVPVGKIRGRKKAVEEVLRQFDCDITDKENYSICALKFRQDKNAEDFAEYLDADNVINIYLGAAIGCHTGPTPVGVAYIKKYKKS